MELDNEINSPEVYNDPDLLRQKSDELRRPAFPSGRAVCRMGGRHGRAGTLRTVPDRRVKEHTHAKNPRSYEKTRHIALSGLLFALAMALSFIEGSLVIPGLLPGMKLGLANIVVMYALFFMGVKQALVLDVLKALFVFLVSGFTAGFLSLCGGLLSLLVMAVLYYVVPVRPTWFILSVCGALAHNVGQLLGAGVIISSSLSLYYAPVMLVLGLVMAH